MTQLAALDDADLVRRCRAGDRDAWNALVERFSRYVYAICVQGFRLSDADAEDVYQEVFTRVYTRLDTLRDDAAIRPWIAQLTRRLCLDARAGSREQPTREPMDAASEQVLADLDEAFVVRDALAELPDHCQEMLDRFFARDESYRTISSELDDPSGNDREPHRALPRQAPRQARGKKPPAPAGLATSDAAVRRGRLGELLRLLRPRRTGWVRAAQELAARAARSTRSSRELRRTPSCAKALVADLEAALDAGGDRARPRLVEELTRRFSLAGRPAHGSSIPP